MPQPLHFFGPAFLKFKFQRVREAAMADVFISYNHEERERISTLLSSLQSLGLSVWFDARIQTGETFDEVIEAELEKAKAILVCWSEKSARSKWVRSEAAIADNQRMLVPCFIERCKLPPPFNLAQAADLTDWSGSVDHPGWSSVLERIGSLAKRPGLFALAQALASSSLDKQAAWAKAYPDDPFATTIWQNWQQRETDQFKQKFEEGKETVAEYFKKRQTSAQKKLTTVKRDFDQWLGKEKDVDLTARPDLATVVAAITGAPSDTANGDPTELQAALSSLETKKTGLETALAKAETRSGELAEELAALRTRPEVAGNPKPWLFALIAVAGLGLGIAGTLIVHPSTQASPSTSDSPEVVALQAKLSDAESQIQKLQQANQTLKDQNTDLQKVENLDVSASAEIISLQSKLSDAEGRLSDAQGQIQQLQNASQTLKDQNRDLQQRLDNHDASASAEMTSLQAKLSDAQGQIQQLQQANQTLKDQNTALQQKADNAGANLQPVSAQANRDADKTTLVTCTLYAGNPYDPDNTTGLGTTDIELSDSALGDAVQSCSDAAIAAKDDITRRRMLAQLGRAYAELAVKIKVKDNDDDQARSTMDKGTAKLREAQELGSRYAMSLLGSSLNGVYNIEAGAPNFFKTDPNEAASWFNKSDIPLAKTIWAQTLLLDKNDNSKKQQALQLLHEAEQQNYPKAFIAHATALIQNQLGNLSEEKAHAAAADLVVHTFCLDKLEFFRFYYRYLDRTDQKNLNKCS